MNWKPKFEPDLSNFHPSAIILANKLRSSHKVKYELDSVNQKEQMKQMDDFSIFDDFMPDSPQQSKSDLDENKEEE